MTATQRVRFAGSLGHELAGQLELPADKTRAFALFAPCFTCPKDAKAIVRISRTLAATGLGVLRYDVTGSGESDGDFVNTSFSTQVSDLLAAAAFLDREHGPPRLLLGISLGGAVAITAAARLDTAAAVVTVNSPAATTSLRSLLQRLDPRIEKDGAGEVVLFGRHTRIGRGFLNDLGRHDPTAAAAALQRPLLVCHAPEDSIVAVDNGHRLFNAASHPKSFHAIDGADHLLLTRLDAADTAAQVIAAWSKPYLPSTT